LAAMIHHEIRPISLRALLCICGFAFIVGYLRWRGTTRGQAPLDKEAKWLIFSLVLALFLVIAAVNAIANRRLGLPQF